MITEQFALWDRGGSRVIRGNLLLIPIGESNLYVEPVFLQATSGGLPELKRVIVATGDKIAMESTLMDSIEEIFGEGTTVPVEPEPEPEIPPPTEPTEPSEPMSPEVAELIEEARQHYEQAQLKLQAGDWAGFGEEWDALQAVLDELAGIIAETD